MVQRRLFGQTGGVASFSGRAPAGPFGQGPVVVIEPHADDAYLSLGAHIEQWVQVGRTVLIVTIFGDTRRSAEAEAYAVWVGAKGVQLGLPSAKVGITQDHPTLLVHPAQIRDAVQRAVYERGQLLLPLGLRHPEHQVVAQALAGPFVGYYMEIPYCLTQKDQPALSVLLAGRAVWSVVHPGRGKAQHVHFFRSQSKFFFYNPPEKWGRAMEMIVGPPLS